MRFLEDGTDIPDKLIKAAAAGDALFLCGAGVSLGVGLPSFKTLTAEVYRLLGESADDEPAERKALEKDEYDRALRSLEKRTHRPGTESRVRKAVAELLIAPPGPFPDHLALLQLSRDSNGRARLLTTNFDTLFERAIVEAGTGTPVSHSGKSIPKPGGERDFGILHLHGRIGDASLPSLETTDLILTSADFGDAYLRDGWASQYMEDRMRLGTLVLVGYAAEDAAMRLLLETLDADRDRFNDLRDVYAMGAQSPESASIWKAKGIKPIEFSDYGAMYSTLKEWASYSIDPDAYAQRRTEEILLGTSRGATP